MLSSTKIKEKNMKTKMLKKLSILSLSLLLTSCSDTSSLSSISSSNSSASNSTSSVAEADTTAPVITSVETEKTTYYTNEPFSISVVASDDQSDNLTITYTLTDPDGEEVQASEGEVTLTKDGQYQIVVTVSDEAGNETDSDPLIVEAFDPYSHWTEEEESLMLESPGYIIPKGIDFKETTTVTQSVNVSNTVLGVIIDNTGMTQDQIADYNEMLVREGYAQNIYETSYFASTILNSTDISVYDKNIENDDYALLQSYYYNDDYKIEARKVTYVMSHEWDEEFVNATLTEDYSALVPAFSFAENNEEGVIYLTDYNYIMESMGTIGAIQGKLFNVTIDEISSYLDTLTEFGYTDASLDDLINNETTMPMYMDMETYAMVMIQISSYLEADIPFYTIDIMCM